ncbi:flagellar type III secretion system pore protein FliP [Limnochorda pilosa]|uniref:Flagellar biosynthetic protein FliP n=1 Tax=Limnochorda pilosa TaxID=1555112 RepID=A0A0K2SK71_LIMPI|nr:flagellar type III secretion system pore protein FliP [Limnochorda pilosa]BAS27513.1 flagellar biosynthesis protein FliP [Limnochorda pilosa]
MRRAFGWVLLVALVWGACGLVAAAQAPPGLSIQLTPSQEPGRLAASLEILAVLTVLSLAPSLLILMTSFTRIVVVLGFVRNALATNQTPPTQLLVGLALFLTFFVMAPTWQAVYQDAVQPYLAEEMTFQEALQQGQKPVRAFMFRFTRQEDLALLLDASGAPEPANQDDVPLHVLVPAFVLSELKSAFQMGFVLFLPFLVIDMVVASALMSMGMFMLPPVMISLPFKLLLFVLVDGWGLIIRSLLASYT